ncbi:MAG TPA: hypothetical protein VJB67_03395 [Patescibacteria group bacterium]|nr:hypothetical protein [Patescibacteria group bacterium]
MIFLLLRILPFVIPIIYFLNVRLLFYFNGYWLWFLALILIINTGYFWLLNLKTKDKNIVYLYVHSVVFAVVGFVYSLFLGHTLFINLFITFWAFIYLIYLESAFHYFYRSKKIYLVDLKKIVPYINLIVFFIASATLYNFYIFLNLSWWWVLLTGLLVSYILVFVDFTIQGFKLSISWQYSLIISLILLEILVALLYVSVSLYVSAIIMAITYYLLVSFSAMSITKELNRARILQYSAFAILTLIIVLSTATWI